jgi:chorismate--pyruvate lyase
MDRWLTALPGMTPYRAWLTNNGSLTLALKRRCANLRVTRLRQGLGLPNLDERPCLGLAAGRLALIREVLLSCEGRPLVFAHSVIPRAGLNGPWRGLSTLGNKPLGEALFADPQVERRALRFRRLDGRHPLYHAAVRHLAERPGWLWARRSVFLRTGHPILVTEVFLPEVLRLPAPLHV